MMHMKAKTFEYLLVWKKAHGYVLEIYRLTAQFPKSEIFGLTAQMRRAAVSIPANIAEGFKKKNATGENPHFKHISGFARGIEVLFDSGRGFGLRRHRDVPAKTRRSLKNA